MSKKTVWDLNPKLKKCFQTSDGTKFFREHDAKAHAKSLGNKEIETLNRTLKKATSNNTKAASNNTGASEKLSHTDRIAAIEKMNTIGEVEAALKDETAKTVKEAGASRIEALKIKAISELTKVEEVEKALEGETSEAVLEAGKTQISVIEKASK